MPSEQFRRQLRQEVKTWQIAGLISPTQFQQLHDRYQFDHLDTQSSNRFTQTLIGVGCVLIGLGVITFVAANWQNIPRIYKVVMLLSLFVGVNVTGFWLWQAQPLNQWRHRLGIGLLLLGALVLGANMALLPQMFHRGGSSYELFLTWGIGVLLMAYSLRLTALGELAILLIGIGYWQGCWQISQTDGFSVLNLIIQQMPLMAGLMYLPLSYLCRSRFLFFLTAVAVVSSLCNIIPILTVHHNLYLAIIAILPIGLLWGYDDGLWNHLLRRQLAEINRPFQSLARQIAILYLGGWLYLMSFQSVWSWTHPSLATLDWLNWHSLPNLLILAGLTMAEWIYLISASRNRSGRLHVNLNTVVLGSFLVIIGLLLGWDAGVSPIPIFATFVTNVLLTLLGLGTMRASVRTGNRRSFWFGIILLTLQIISRLMEYQTDLLLKAVVFVLCGVGILTAGLWFERYARTITPSPEAFPEESP